MSAAFLPSPARGVWQVGPVPVRAYALCAVVGVACGLWLARRYYRAAGGRNGLVLDLAAVAVPVGLVGARLYSAVTDYRQFFGHNHDWVNVLRIWDGSLGVPGAVAGGALAAWIYCRRAGVAISPLAGAAAPALAVAQGIGSWGGWFAQNLYGRPSGLTWAVEITPVHRLTGYQDYATFQPVFLYESLWALAMAVALIYARRRLTGDRVLALYLCLYAIGRFGAESLRIGRSPHLLGLRVNQVLMIAVLAAAVAYLRVSRKGADRKPAGPPARAAAQRRGGTAPARAAAAAPAPPVPAAPVAAVQGTAAPATPVPAPPIPVPAPPIPVPAMVRLKAAVAAVAGGPDPAAGPRDAVAVGGRADLPGTR